MNVKEQLEVELNKFRSILGIEKIGYFEGAIKNDIICLLETEPFNALKERRQLGLISKIGFNEWENADHTRYDHSVGVVAKCLIATDIINENTDEKDLKLTEKDVRELVVAAALHDCGHFPLSHATERAFITAKGIQTGNSHEERIVPLIVNRNSYFENLRDVILAWAWLGASGKQEKLDEISFYRIASIISPKMGDEFSKKIKDFKMPKRAIQQLLVSDIDMDRLDYVTRDAEKLNYVPVTLIIDKIYEYIKGLSLISYRSLNQELYPDNNVELCLNEEKKDNVFYLLVSRVLLYKYIYFSEKLRSFEAILTYLVGTLIENDIAFEPLNLITMSDNDFIDKYLEHLVQYIDGKEEFKKELIEKYINVLRNDKAERFKKLTSIKAEDIKNPRLKEEFMYHIDKRSYIDNLKTYIYKKEAPGYFEGSDLLIDVFKLKTGGGDLMISNKKGDFTEYNILDKYMNGSNMHKLCSETRLDFYVKSDINDKKRGIILSGINDFYKNI